MILQRRGEWYRNSSSGKVKEEKRRRNFSEHDEKGKRRRKVSQRKTGGHVIFCLFSLGEKTQQDCEKREVEALRSNSIE